MTPEDGSKDYVILGQVNSASKAVEPDMGHLVSNPSTCSNLSPANYYLLLRFFLMEMKVQNLLNMHTPLSVHLLGLLHVRLVGNGIKVLWSP